jgi:hypothetical protein
LDVHWVSLSPPPPTAFLNAGMSDCKRAGCFFSTSHSFYAGTPDFSASSQSGTGMNKNSTSDIPGFDGGGGGEGNEKHRVKRGSVRLEIRKPFAYVLKVLY